MHADGSAEDRVNDSQRASAEMPRLLRQEPFYVFCRRISIDTDDRIVEVSDADYPADRTELQFVTPLKPWHKSCAE